MLLSLTSYIFLENEESIIKMNYPYGVDRHQARHDRAFKYILWEKQSQMSDHNYPMFSHVSINILIWFSRLFISYIYEIAFQLTSLSCDDLLDTKVTSEIKINTAHAYESIYFTYVDKNKIRLSIKNIFFNKLSIFDMISFYFMYHKFNNKNVLYSKWWKADKSTQTSFIFKNIILLSF